MTTDDLKKMYGDEYPAAIVADGVRMRLTRESRFLRNYDSEDGKMGHWVSRFMDGSASITLGEIQREWPAWTENERYDFCNFCSPLDGQPDFPDMLRFIMQHGGPKHWSGIAMSVASQLPRDEAFQILLLALQRTDVGQGSNITQGIALTKHPEAEVTLRHHLQVVWRDRTLLENDDFINWAAFDATTCIADLLELGTATADFDEQVRKLSRHVCQRNRDSCRGFLSKYYSWLKED